MHATHIIGVQGRLCRNRREAMGEPHAGERRYRKYRPVRSETMGESHARTPVHGSTGRTAARQDAVASRAERRGRSVAGGASDRRTGRTTAYECPGY